MKHRHKILYLSGVGVIVVCLVAVWFFVRQPRPVKVTLASVSTHTLQTTMFESGTVKPFDRQIVYGSQLSGTVSNMKVKVGDEVKKGQLLFTVLSQNGYIYDVDSKMSGEVLLENESGMNPDGTPAPIIEVVSPQKIIVANVSELDGVQIYNAMKGTISSDAFPGETFAAKVSHVANYATENQSGSGQVEVDLLPVKPIPIPLGYEVDIHILGTPHAGVLAVPYSALVQDGDRYVVFRYLNGRVQSVAVTLGVTTDNEVEVTKGLHLGDKVVLNPPANLVSGAGVTT